jgi:DNA-binding response OmpR family regulator
MNAAQILIVDDDTAIREMIGHYVQEHHYLPIEAEDGESAVRMFRSHRPDLVLLDVMMPDMDGFTVCRQIRKESDVPIIYLSSRGESRDVVHGLDLGGDDYVEKPFEPEILMARIKAQLRRTRKTDKKRPIVFGDLVIDRETCEVRCRDTVIPFLAKEFKLLVYLAERPRRVFHVDQLYEEVWNSFVGDTRTVMVHISNIRQKLAAHAPEIIRIETVKGIGYRLVVC